MEGSQAVELTQDALYCVFKHLSAGDLLMCALVCRSWNKAANRDLLWEQVAALSWRSDGFKKRYIEWLRKEIRDYYMPLNRLSCMERDYSTGQVRLKDSVLPASCVVYGLVVGEPSVELKNLFAGLPFVEDLTLNAFRRVCIKGKYDSWRGDGPCRIPNIVITLIPLNGSNQHGASISDYRSDFTLAFLPSPMPKDLSMLPQTHVSMVISYPADGETWGDDTPYIKYCAEKKIPYVRATADPVRNVESPKSFYHLEVPKEDDNWKTFQDKGIPSLHRWQSALLELAASTTGHPRSLLTLEQLESLLPKAVIEKSRKNFEAISKARYGLSGPGSPAGPAPGSIDPTVQYSPPRRRRGGLFSCFQPQFFD